MSNKYHNIKVEVDGYKFDSKKEAEFYQDLLLLKRSGELLDFEVHPKIILQEGFKFNGKKIQQITHSPDFILYWEGGTEFIDVKGGKATQTQAWRLKWKLLMFKYRGDEKSYMFTVV